MSVFDRHRLTAALHGAFDRPVLRSLGRRGYSALRRASFALSPARGRGAVVFAGDSLIDQWSTLAEDFPGLETVNRGIGGDGALELLLRFPEDVLALRPCAVVILVGTNDLAQGEAPERVAETLRRLLALAAESDVPAVVCLLPPRTKEPGLFPEKIRELNALIGLAPAAAVCDAFTPLATEDGGPREECFVDGLHLNAAGYRELKAALAPHLADFRNGAKLIESQ